MAKDLEEIFGLLFQLKASLPYIAAAIVNIITLVLVYIRDP